MNQPIIPIPPQTVVPGVPSSVSTAAQNAIHAWVSAQSRVANQAGDPRMAMIRITDTAPTSDGLLTGYKLFDNGSLDPSAWVDDEAVHVIWPNGSNQPPELAANTFGEARIYLGWRIGIATSGGNYRAVYLVSLSTVVVPVYIETLTPTTGYFDATFDVTGAGGGGASSTCWALCLNSGDALVYNGPYLGMLSGKVTNSGSERPRVLFHAPGVRSGIAGASPTDVFMQQIRFDENGFQFNGTTVELTHTEDEVSVAQDGSAVGTVNGFNFVATATVSPSVTESPAGTARIEMQLTGGPYVPTSDVDTAPAANKIMRADANGTSNYTPSATHAGLNVGSLAGDPSSPAVGDIHYNSSVGRYKIYR